MIGGGASYDVIDGTLRRPEALDMVPKTRQRPLFNPGITSAGPPLVRAAQPETELEESCFV